MVKILDGKNTDIAGWLVCRFFTFQKHFTHIAEVNHPEEVPCIYALWHSHQCATYGIRHREKLNVLISRSRDGEVVARGVECLGMKTIRGSKGKRGAVEASMQMISALKDGENCAMMVDGPRGPAGIVKDGIIKIAKLAGVPIVPVIWYSDNFTLLKLPSWDGLRFPILTTNLINLYGEPIYVSDEEGGEEEARQKLQNSLEELDRRAPKEFNEVYKFGLWRRKKKK